MSKSKKAEEGDAPESAEEEPEGGGANPQQKQPAKGPSINDVCAEGE